MPGAEYTSAQLRQVERRATELAAEVIALKQAFAASQADLSTARAQIADLLHTIGADRNTAYDLVSAELVSARQEIERLKDAGGCDCGHEVLDETWHLRPCPVAEARFARRRAGGAA